MKKKIIATGLLASLLVVGSASGVIYSTTTAEAVATQQQGRQLVSLGASLDQNQAQQTLQLLGASHIPANQITYVDGNMVNRYLNDGSNAGTTVLSSAYINEMPAGYGVQVNIVTPQNITLVSPQTYQNAAITAGVKNAQLNIATIAPVTGEGALAGVYAVLEQQGLLNQQDATVAQEEIKVINQVTNQTKTEINMDIFFSEVKQEITINNVQNQGRSVEEIVRELADTAGITDEQVLQDMIAYFESFSQTTAAQDEETVEQLEKSIQENWKDQLTSLEETVAAEDILADERLDFSDESVYHPIIQAFTDKFYELVEAGQSVEPEYSHTFVFERMTPDMSAEEKQALNELRTLMYQYEAHTVPDSKQKWLDGINAYEMLKAQDPVLAEIIARASNANGYAPEVYNYQVLTQESTQIVLQVKERTANEAVIGNYGFDTKTVEISYMEGESTFTPIPFTFDFEAVYGVEVQNFYPEQPIPEDYTVPGFEKEVTEPTEEDASSEEAPESSEQLNETESVEEQPQPASAEEEVQPEPVPEETQPEPEPAPEEVTEAPTEDTDTGQ